MALLSCAYFRAVNSIIGLFYFGGYICFSRLVLYVHNTFRLMFVFFNLNYLIYQPKLLFLFRNPEKMDVAKVFVTPFLFHKPLILHAQVPHIHNE